MNNPQPEMISAEENLRRFELAMDQLAQIFGGGIVIVPVEKPKT